MMDDDKLSIVKQGSLISAENRLPNQKGEGSSASLHQKLIDNGVIIDCKFTRDYEF